MNLFSLKTSDFDFTLPPELIAQHPLPQRTESRLLVTSRDGKNPIQHKKFKDIVDFISPGDLLVFNNSKVMKARLFGQKRTGGKVELLIERILDPKRCLAHVGTNKSLKMGTEIVLDDLPTFIRIDENREGLFVISLHGPDDIWTLMDTKGHIPLPTYIHREDEKSDESRYQTVYAKSLGSVAAPTAGLHFDEPLLAKLKSKGVEFAEVTLHVGAGTFKPVKTENINEHKMHAEWIEVSEATCQKINETKRRGNKVFAVGTTSVRSLESAAKAQDMKSPFEDLRPYQGDTSIFITPPYEFKVVDSLITNFHLPQSTLVMLVSAFSSRTHILKCYQSAIDEQYRFFSYGDAMLIQ
jgi:S-adenosylmethionine:tRNA ribosyltransferase-isomerase